MRTRGLVFLVIEWAFFESWLWGTFSGGLLESPTALAGLGLLTGAAVLLDSRGQARVYPTLPILNTSQAGVKLLTSGLLIPEINGWIGVEPQLRS